MQSEMDCIPFFAGMVKKKVTKTYFKIQATLLYRCFRCVLKGKLL